MFLPPHLNPLPLWGEEIIYNVDWCNLVLDIYDSMLKKEEDWRIVLQPDVFNERG